MTPLPQNTLFIFQFNLILSLFYEDYIEQDTTPQFIIE